MPTISLSTEQFHPPIPLSRLSVLDRLALHSGTALIRWVDRSQERSRRLVEQHRQRPSWSEHGRLQAEREHEDALLRSSTLYWHLR